MLSVGYATPQTLDQSAPVISPTITGVIGSSGLSTYQDGQPQSFATAPTTTTTTTNNVTGGTGGTTTATAPKVLNTAAIDNTQKSIDALPGILAAALGSNDQSYMNADQGFNVQQQQQQAQYDTGTTTNQQNYDANLMAALRSGASGLGGLLSILRGTGVENWARQAVGDTTNSDIRTGLDTRNQNQTGLDTSLTGVLNDLAEKRHLNDVTHQNNDYSARGNNATQLQDLYTKMAGYYADVGDTATATKYMNLAGNLTPDVARYGTTPVAAYNTTPAVVKAAPVSAFNAPTQQAVTYDPGASGANSSIFTIGDARKRLAGA